MTSLSSLASSLQRIFANEFTPYDISYLMTDRYQANSEGKYGWDWCMRLFPIRDLLPLGYINKKSTHYSYNVTDQDIDSFLTTSGILAVIAQILASQTSPVAQSILLVSATLPAGTGGTIDYYTRLDKSMARSAIGPVPFPVLLLSSLATKLTPQPSYSYRQLLPGGIFAPWQAKLARIKHPSIEPVEFVISKAPGLPTTNYLVSAEQRISLLSLDREGGGPDMPRFTASQGADIIQQLCDIWRILLSNANGLFDINCFYLKGPNITVLPSAAPTPAKLSDHVIHTLIERLITIMSLSLPDFTVQSGLAPSGRYPTLAFAWTTPAAATPENQQALARINTAYQQLVDYNPDGPDELEGKYQLPEYRLTDPPAHSLSDRDISIVGDLFEQMRVELLAHQWRYEFYWLDMFMCLLAIGVNSQTEPKLTGTYSSISRTFMNHLDRFSCAPHGEHPSSTCGGYVRHPESQTMWQRIDQKYDGVFDDENMAHLAYSYHSLFNQIEPIPRLEYGAPSTLHQPSVSSHATNIDTFRSRQRRLKLIQEGKWPTLEAKNLALRQAEKSMCHPRRWDIGPLDVKEAAAALTRLVQQTVAKHGLAGNTSLVSREQPLLALEAPAKSTQTLEAKGITASPTTLIKPLPSEYHWGIKVNTIRLAAPGQSSLAQPFATATLARVFINTPLSLVAQAAETNNQLEELPWLTMADIQLIADFLAGKTMLNTLCWELSDAAFDVLSAPNALLGMYEFPILGFSLDRIYKVNQAFVDQVLASKGQLALEQWYFDSFLNWLQLFD